MNSLVTPSLLNTNLTANLLKPVQKILFSGADVAAKCKVETDLVPRTSSSHPLAVHKSASLNN